VIGDGHWGVGDPFGDPLLPRPERGADFGVMALVGPPGCGKRVWVREAMGRLSYSVPVLLRVDGRELHDLSELGAALLSLAEVAASRWPVSGTDGHDLTAAWKRERLGKYGRTPPPPTEWRATPARRRASIVRDGPPSPFATTMQAGVLVLVEHADEWAARLGEGDREALHAACIARVDSSIPLVLLGRHAAPFASWLGEDAVVTVPATTVEEVAPWLQSRFGDGGWNLPDAEVAMLVSASDAQPRTLVRLADHLWRTLPPPPVTITPEHLRDAARRAVDEMVPVYEAAWGACTPVQRTVLRMVWSEGGKRPTRRRPAAFPLGASTIQRAVQALEARGLVWREEGHGGQVRFTDALIGLWVQGR
jgi:hypothetical protein